MAAQMNEKKKKRSGFVKGRLHCTSTSIRSPLLWTPRWGLVWATLDLSVNRL